jgi:hypothetical protein
VRRVVGVLATAALALVLCPVVARAAGLSFPSGAFDLRSQLMMRLFGETSDSRASFAAEYGDRASESPLRGLALQIQPTDQLAAFTPDVFPVAAFTQARAGSRDASERGVSDLAQVAESGIWQSGVQFSPASVASSENDGILSSSNALSAAAYQPVAPAPSISPGRANLAFGRLVNAPAAFVDRTPSQTAQIGNVHFQGHGETLSTETPQISLHDNAYNAGASFNVRTGKQSLNLNLSSSYEQVARNDSSSFSSSALASAPSWQLPGTDVPLAVPNYANLNRFSIGAGVAVPVLRGLTLNLNYNAQRYYGGYGLPGLVNLDTVNNSYGGGLTFDIPHTSSTLSVSAYQNRYQDNLLPINGSTQTREDVNFTVKF